MIRLFLVFICTAMLFSGCRKRDEAVPSPFKNQEAAVSNKIHQASVEKTELIHQIVAARREMIRIETRAKMKLTDPTDKAALKTACIADPQWVKLSDELKSLQSKTRETHIKMAAAFAEQDALVSSNKFQQLPAKDLK